MAKKIIFVDDDRQVIRELNQLFKDTSYETQGFESSEAALLFMEEQQVDLVVADIKMSGLELLRKVRETYPKTLRLISGATNESNMAYRAVEENIATMFFFEPWDDRELIKMIDNLFNYQDVLNDKNMLDLINNMDDLPTVPKLYKKISKLITDEEDVDKISKVIESDQATASKVLRIGNSAFYGKSTGSIKQAIMFIGLSNVKNIVLASSVFIMGGALKESIVELWKHSTLTNRYTSLFYQEFLGKKIPTYFASAGLLHNIGMIALLRSKGKVYSSIVEDLLMYDEIYKEKEKECFGVTHEEIGAFLLNWWQLPSPIVESARYHHDPLNPMIINKELVQVVHVANYMAWAKIKGDRESCTDKSYVSECCLSFGICEEQVFEYFEGLEESETLVD